jgi:hypothetical protein
LKWLRSGSKIGVLFSWCGDGEVLRADAKASLHEGIFYLWLDLIHHTGNQQRYKINCMHFDQLSL